MKRILSLGVLALLLYLGYDYGRPYFDDLLAQQGVTGGGGDDSVCVRNARRTTEKFASSVGRLSPPIDPADWQSTLSMARGRLETTRNACRCSEPACSTTSKALDQLDELMNLYDRMIGSNDATFNPANRLESIYDALDRANQQTGR